MQVQEMEGKSRNMKIFRPVCVPLPPPRPELVCFWREESIVPPHGEGGEANQLPGGQGRVEGRAQVQRALEDPEVKMNYLLMLIEEKGYWFFYLVMNVATG